MFQLRPLPWCSCSSPGRLEQMKSHHMVLGLTGAALATSYIAVVCILRCANLIGTCLVGKQTELWCKKTYLQREELHNTHHLPKLVGTLTFHTNWVDRADKGL
jgi:hypothetical protein